MFIVRENLTRDAILEQVDACLRMASAIARGNESVVPTAQLLLQRLGTPGSVSRLVDSTLGTYRDSELLPRGDDVLATLESMLPSHELPAPPAEAEAPEDPGDPAAGLTASVPPRARRRSERRRRRTGSIL